MRFGNRKSAESKIRSRPPRLSLDASPGQRHIQVMKRLFLLDGMALIYRAHFALIQSPIRTSEGLNTSALYGFINTLLAILEKENPSHIGVAFDTSAPTSRHIRYPAYKAQRDEMPEELAAAIPHVKSLCRAFRIPVLEIDGFEADDIIGTLVKRAEGNGFESFMVTPDKDFAQLISPTTFMWKPGRRGGDHEVISLPQLTEIWSVEKPEQIIDLLGLMGDASDNIPGVPGVGLKTAQKLIAQFGSVENLIRSSDQLKGKQKERIEEHSEQAVLSKELATIITDVPVDTTWEDLALSARNDDAIKELFTEFEFRSLTKRLFGETGQETVTATTETPSLLENYRTIRDIEHAYQLADSPEKQQELFQSLARQSSFCFDIEATSLNRFGAELLGLAFAWNDHEAWYLPWDETLREQVASLLSSAAEKIGHNLKYDLCVLQRHGVEVTGPFFDTMLADALAAPDRRHSMDYLSQTLLDYTPISLKDIAVPPSSEETSEDDLFSYASKAKATKELDMRAIPMERLAEYAAEDADITMQLSKKIRAELEAGNQARVYREIESPLLPVLVRMEMEGIAVDPTALQRIGQELQQQIDSHAKAIHRHADKPFNIASPKQLGEVLFDQLKIADKPKKTKTGQYKTDEATLTALQGKHPMISEILSWREATKLKSTYLDALPNHIVPATGRIHTHFHQLVAATGRLASSDPNLQNIPVRSEAGRRIRKAFVPRMGFTLLSCDYSQIELRVMAALANDQTMIDAFRNGTDIHAVTASKVFSITEDSVTSDMRRTAKMVNFGIIYGISAFGLSQRLGIPRSEANEIIETYFREYPAIKSFMEETVGQARNDGYVSTLSGRRRLLPDLQSGNQNIRGNAERAAINTPIQGTSADMIKLAMIRIDEFLRNQNCKTRMLLQVHDELVFDLATDEAEELVLGILDIMRTALPLPNDVPIEVESGTGSHWLEAH